MRSPLVFTFEGKETKPSTLEGFLGAPGDGAYLRTQSVEVEEGVLYFNTRQGVTLCLKIDKLEWPTPPKKYAKVIEVLRQAIKFWDQEMERCPVKTLEASLQKQVLDKGFVNAEQRWTLALTDLPGTERDFQEYLETQERHQRKEWLPEELAHCPQCREIGLFNQTNPPRYCIRHEWYDPTVYEGWHYFHNGTIAGPNKRGALELQRVRLEAKEQALKEQMTKPMQVLETGGHLFIHTERIAPHRIPEDRLIAYGNLCIDQYKQATAYMQSAEFYRLSPDCKAWAVRCMDEFKAYIQVLRDRKAAFERGEIPKPAVVIQAPSRPGEVAEKVQRLKTLEAQWLQIQAVWTDERIAKATPGEAEAAAEYAHEIATEFHQLWEQVQQLQPEALAGLSTIF